MRRWLLFSSVTVVALAADLLSKGWARANLEAGNPVAVVQGFFDWRLSFNRGSAFSMFDGWGHTQLMLSVVGFLALAAIVWMAWTADPARRWRIGALALIAGGAAGNLIDRLARGEVTDFVSWHYYDSYWPIFNLADAFLLVGVAIMMAAEIVSSRKVGART